MLENKNRKNKTVMGGIGIALLLCILMVGMSMSGLVQNSAPEEATNLVAADDGIEDDMFALPEVYEQEEIEYDPSAELVGERGLHQKAYLQEDGSKVLLIGNDPVHYMSDEGSWEEIDLNLKATLYGWEVTENNFDVYFPAEVEHGVALVVSDNIDPIITGVNPTVTIIRDDVNPMPLKYENAEDTEEKISVGGNVIRYPVSTGFDLDYSVGKNGLKQNLVIKERPILDEGVAWFGLTEEIKLPLGYGLYSGNELVSEEIVSTQGELTIRNLETGALLVTIPEPIVIEQGAEEPYIGTYFVQSFGGNIVITTAVEGSWLMDEERQFPLAIDPSMNVYSSAGGTCYQWNTCSSSTYRYFRKYGYGAIYYMPWQKFTFPSSTALGSTASVDSIHLRTYTRQWYGSTGYTPKYAVMEDCGYQYVGRYSYTPPTRSCSGAINSNLLTNQGYMSSNGMRMRISQWNSADVANQPTGTGWKNASFCTSSTTCGSGGSNYIADAAKNGGTVGITSKYTGSVSGSYFQYYTYAYGGYNSYLIVAYSGVSDNSAPNFETAAYSGITSYVEGARTMFAQLSDFTGVDTTSSGAPHMYYRVDSGSWNKVKATTLGTCSGSSAKDCKFKAKTADLSVGNYVEYFWAFRDTAASPNTETSPAGGAIQGSTAEDPDSVTVAPSTLYWFEIDSAENASNDEMKLTTSVTKVSAYSTTSPQRTFDRQMTYYNGSKEYVHEFDTSRCGTGAQSCFYANAASTFYANWKVMWSTAPAYTSNGYGGTLKGLDVLDLRSGGFLALTADDGPGMNLAFLYDTSVDKWAMVGIGDETGIENPLTSGETPAYDSRYGYAYAYSIKVPFSNGPENITGTFGEFDWGTTYSSSTANWICLGTNGVIQFFRYSATANPTCNVGYYYLYRPANGYVYNGFALGSGYYGIQDGSGDMLVKVNQVKPQPDLTAPTVNHNPLLDSHSRDRTVTAGIVDGGEPPSGLNTSGGLGIAPTIYYRITDADGTTGSWQSSLLVREAGKTAEQCESIECLYSHDFEDLERGSEVEYSIKVQDLSPASSGVNVLNTTATSFEVGDPNKMFVIEWHDWL